MNDPEETAGETHIFLCLSSELRQAMRDMITDKIAELTDELEGFALHVKQPWIATRVAALLAEAVPAAASDECASS